MTVLVDMDEVLTDFVEGSLRIHGWTRERLERVWQPGSWSIIEPMGMTADEFWAPINAAGEEFWLGLEPTPWARDLIEGIDRLTCDWYIVSSPSQSPSAYSGKVGWLRRFLNDGFDRVVITGHKHLLARPGNVLVDDREESVEQFIDAGGQGIVFPSRYNSLHWQAENPVRFVLTELRRLI